MADKTFDRRAFVKFCRSKQPGERYEGMDASHCALAQFGISGADAFNHADLGIPYDVIAAAVVCGTFGALADRLSKAA